MQGALTYSILEHVAISDNINFRTTQLLSVKSVVDFDAKCFTPSHFDESQKQFAQRACSAYIWDTKHRVNFDNSQLPMPDQAEELKMDKVSNGNLSKPLELYYWFIVEGVVILAGFMITRMVTLCLSSAEMVIHHVIRASFGAKQDMVSMEDLDSESEKHEEPADSTKQSLSRIARGRMIFILYLLVEFLLMLIWFGLSGKAMVIQTDRQDLASADTSNVMCEFHLSRLGNTQKFVTQCQLPSMNNLYMVSMANVALCFTVAVFLLIHVVYTAVIAPFLVRGPMDSILKQAGVKSISAAFSDLTLLAILQNHPYKSH